VKSLSPSPAAFRRALLAWYSRSGRHDLPWRKEWSAYHVLVSEFMLQQTTVSTVVPYFKRFLKEFPTVRALAAAPVERVLELWSGLGYYARARNLHAAAGMLVRDFGGRLPETPDGVRALPGVGRYTSGALLSFTYDKPEALVDGNVIRVLSRVYGIKDNVKDPAAVEKIWALSWKLVPPGGARHFNSALMDFGATVCRPSGPDCLLCPFFASCFARKRGLQARIPLVVRETERRRVHVAVALLENRGRWLLSRRPAGGLYGGLWEFPGEETEGKPDARQASACLSRRLGAPVKALEALSDLKHTLSHREMHLHPWLCAAPAFRPAGDGQAWVRLEEIPRRAVSSLTRKVLENLAAARQN
jgi:A/G-specific adenine glycosylase